MVNIEWFFAKGRGVLVWGGLILFLLAVGLGACDQGGFQSTEEAPDDEATDTMGLSYRPMPTGASLPTPREERGVLDFSGKVPGKSTNTMESPYGCYLASRPYSDSTRFRSIYLYFPSEMLEGAGYETKRHIQRLSASQFRVEGEGVGVRFAHCVIPAAEGAQELATEQILSSGEEEAAWEVARTSNSSTSAKGCIQIIRTSTTCVGGGGSFPEEHCETTTEVVGVICGGGGNDGSDEPTDPWPDDGGGGGGSGGGSGDTCTELNPEPGSECEPEDPCESDNPPSYCQTVNPDELCPSDPLEEMEIRPTCSGVDGGRFNGRSGDHDGIDLLADVGTNLHASVGGTVSQVGQDPGGWGNYIVIESSASDDRFFLYAHLNSVEVEEGGSVTEGEVVGGTGISGNACSSDCSCGPAHVHLEVRKGASEWYNADPQNPEDYIGTEFNNDGDAVSDSC